MTKTPIIYPYRMGSRAATALARALGTRKVFPDRNYRLRDNHLIINYGSGRTPDWINRLGSPIAMAAGLRQFLNHPQLLGTASNKAETFGNFLMNGVPTVDFTVNIETAREWGREGHTVICRTMLRASGGRGIVVAERPDQIVPAPLYTKYMKKLFEFRVHIFQGRVIDIQQKRKRNGVEADAKIRNHENGWVFARQDVDCPDAVVDAAVAAIDSLGLDFGAVDVIYNSHYRRPAVLEVNTAPGLEGTTLINYCDAIRRACNN